MILVEAATAKSCSVDYYRKPDRCCEILFPRNIKGAHFAVGFDCSHHHLPKGAPL